MPVGPPAGTGPAGGARGAASAGSKAPNSSPPTRSSSANDRPARGRQSTRPAPAGENPSEAVAATAAIPVSAALAARDAVVDASTRRHGGADPLKLARRIAAALNAPVKSGAPDFGFFWITAVTDDDEIVVANSFGLAFIPDGVRLPEPVRMASADDSIPPAERARWATYPVLAVLGWAAHHNTGLRAVIGTKEQFTNTDPGTTKVILQPDEIPDNGAMAGRSRLEVVNNSAAERLSSTPDGELLAMLAPAPAKAGPAPEEDSTRDEPDGPGEANHDKDDELRAKLTELRSGPVDLKRLAELLPALPARARRDDDRRPALWFEVVKPMMSNAGGRELAHLRAFHTYAAHAQQVALTEAHGTAAPERRRAAIADWLYWKHLTGLLEEALALPVTR